MDQDKRSWARLLNQARQHLLTTGGVPPLQPGPSAEILESWRRSLEEGADAADLRLPYDDNVNLTTRLVRAAEPVLKQLSEDLIGNPVSVVLADSRGKILLRKSGELQLMARLDQAMLAPGFSYAEKFAGTNGIGTALEQRDVVAVTHAEHFNERLHEFACVGVPIRDPLTRRVLGVLDITTWADRAHEAFTLLAVQAARSIEDELLDLAGSGSRALLDDFVVARRGRESSVVAVGPNVLLGSADAVRRLGGVARDELWALVAAELGLSDHAELPLDREDGESLLVRIRAVRAQRGELVGGSLHLVEQPTRDRPAPAPRPGVGRAIVPHLSPIAWGPAALVVERAAARQPVAVAGEAGVGKRSVVERVAHAVFPGRLLAVIAARDVASEDLPASVAAALDAGKPVVVTGADTLDDSTLAQVLETTHGSGGWLALTMRQSLALDQSSQRVPVLDAAGVPSVLLPPLRARTQDLERALPEMVARLSGGRVTSLSPAVVSAFLREPWLGNFTEVNDVLTAMIAASTGSELGVDSLPAEFGSGVARRLTPLEWMQRDAIVAALHGCDGDKARAAEALGMSRASIYRKIKAYAIEVDPA